jgi:hypothetical protein
VKSIIGGIALLTLVSPASANEYWVDYNYSTHECSIVEKNSPDTAADAAQGATAADSANIATTSDATQGANVAKTIAQAAAAGVAPVIVVTGPNDQTTSDQTTSDQTTSDQTTSDVTRGANAANTITEGIASGAPNAATSSNATRGANAANATTEGGASNTPNAASTSGTPANTGTGGNDFDPVKALAASWARKKAAAEAAGTDTTHALIGTAMHSREEAESEMQVMRKCGLRP